MTFRPSGVEDHTNRKPHLCDLTSLTGSQPACFMVPGPGDQSTATVTSWQLKNFRREPR